jgi:hypothetical protein
MKHIWTYQIVANDAEMKVKESLPREPTMGPKKTVRQIEFFFFFFFCINVIYFKIELKGGLNCSLDFTSPVYRCSNYTTRTGHKLNKRASRQTERENDETSRERVQIETRETILHLSENESAKHRKMKLIT